MYTINYWTCQCCKKKKGVRINAHHIESYLTNKDLRLTTSNGITLCYSCHYEFHKKYGYKDNNRKQFNEFIGESEKTSPLVGEDESDLSEQSEDIKYV